MEKAVMRETERRRDQNKMRDIKRKRERVHERK